MSQQPQDGAVRLRFTVEPLCPFLPDVDVLVNQIDAKRRAGKPFNRFPEPLQNPRRPVLCLSRGKRKEQTHCPRVAEQEIVSVPIIDHIL